jgi:hypothetical protein
VTAKARYSYADIVTTTSAALLIGVMLVFAWYGGDGIPGRTARLVYTENGWAALRFVRWIVLFTVVAVAGAAVLHLSQRSHGSRTNTGLAVTLLGGLTAAALIYRVLIALPSADQVVDQKLGAFLGVVCALGIAYGGLESLRAERLTASAGRAV